MDMKDIVKKHGFFDGLDEGALTLIAGCASNVRFEAGQFLFHEGDHAGAFYLIKHGAVALQIHAPHQEMTLLTLGEGDLAGVSWIAPPYKASFDARALETTTAIAFDANCLRTKCDADPVLGYDLMKRFTALLTKRLHATRMQVIDVYGG